MSKREKALTDCLVENQARLYRLAYSYLNNREDALDAVQAAACTALEKQDGLRDLSAVWTWCARILVNTCLDMLRRQKRLVLVPPEELDIGSYEDPPLADETLARRVDALPPEMATVIRLRFYEDMTLDEISAVTGCNVNTVKSRLYTGLKRLRITMEGANRDERV